MHACRPTLRTGPRPPALLLLALLLPALLPAAAGAAPAVFLAPGLGSPREVVVVGRVYREAPTAGSSTLARNLRRLAAPGWVGAPVAVSLGGVRVEVTSGADGDFEARLPAPPGAPFRPGLHAVSAQVPGGRPARAAADVVDDAAPFLLVSDFDDTLAQSHVLDARALVASALLRDADTQPAVEGMADFYRCLRTGRRGGPPPGFALVSGSPVQYGPRILRFLARHGFPHFGLALRRLSPATLRGYKQPRIRDLLGLVRAPAVLVGDSGEHDPEVYAEVRAAAPGRVLAVYIRDVGRSQDPARFEGMVLFREPAEAAWDAAARGLASEACVRAAFPRPSPR